MNKKRINEIENFLKGFRDAYIRYPNLTLNDDAFYNELKFYDFDEKARNDCSIDQICNNWINYYSNDKARLNVKFDSRQPGFIQFNNYNLGNTRHFEKHYKLYLSFDKEHIKDSTIEIFNFIRDNDIKHLSKVSRKVRSDAVVLRLVNKEDVKLVLDFVNKNKNIKNKAKTTNPFLGRINNVGIAYDDCSSYNSVVSHVLSLYFNYRSTTNSLNYVSYNDFISYVHAYRNELDKNYQLLEKECDYNVFPYAKDDNIEKRALNLKQIVKMLELNITKDLTIDEYINTVELFRNDKYNDKDLANISYKSNKSILSKIKNVFLGSTSDGNSNNDDKDEIKEMYTDRLLEICKLTYKRYGSDQLEEALNKGLYGNFSYFSNEKDEYGHVTVNNREFLRNNFNQKNTLDIYKNLIMKYRNNDNYNNNDIYKLISDISRESLEKEEKTTCIL